MVDFSFHAVELRVKDPEASISFYTKYFDMETVKKSNSEDGSYTTYSLATLKGEHKGVAGCFLQLHHIHGTEKKSNFHYHNGNTSPKSYGHVGFLVDDVYQLCDRMIKDGVSFQKKPDEGKMKGLAFSLDPDGYWVEIIKRSESASFRNKASFQQVMLRISNPERTLQFYKDIMGMTLLQKLDFPEGKFTLYFLSSLKETDFPNSELGSDKRSQFLWSWEGTTIELTHNYEESEIKFYQNDEKIIEGFDGLSFSVDSKGKASRLLEKHKIAHNLGKSLLSFSDPDGYPIKVVAKENRAEI